MVLSYLCRVWEGSRLPQQVAAPGVVRKVLVQPAVVLSQLVCILRRVRAVRCVVQVAVQHCRQVILAVVRQLVNQQVVARIPAERVNRECVQGL
jgi:hypothetical protein